MELWRRVWGEAKRILCGGTVLLLAAVPSFGGDDSRLFTSGFEAFSGGDSKQAARTLGHLLEAYPGTRLRELALFYLARAHFRAGNQEDAARAMTRLLQEYPGTSLSAKAEKELMGLVVRYRRGEKLSRGDDELDALPAGTLAAVSAASENEAAGLPEKNADREKSEQERVAREQAAREEAARRKAEAERLARERAEAERRAQEEAERERVAREQAAREEAARRKAETERLARERAEAERRAQEQAERERVAREQAAREEAARRKAETERLAREQAEAERRAREQAEAERRAREEAERVRLSRRKEQPVRENVPAKRPAAPLPAAAAPVAAQGAGAEISGPLLRAVVKTDTTELTPGDQVEYLVTLLNVGGRRAEGVALRLMFPDGAYEPVDFARSGFRNEGGGALVLDDVAIDSGQALEYPVVFRVRNDAVMGQELRCSVRLLNGAIGTWDSYRSRASFVRAPRRP